jgi:leader peptidase (prepilin peptidase)/N-methyltransferase
MLLLIAALFSVLAVGALALVTTQAAGVFWVLLGAAFGACVGSFLNVVAYRLPVMLRRAWRRESRDILELPVEPAEPRFDLVLPRSRCPHCNHQISARDNIPVLGYALLRGRCAHCKAPISARYPSVELATGVATAAVLALFGPTVQALVVCGFVWMSLAIALIDADTYLIPDSLSLPLLWSGLLLSAAGIGPTPSSALLGAAAGYGALWTVNTAYKLVRKVDGMGQGDFKYLAACGAFLGAKPLVVVILVASVTGVLWSVFSALRGARAVSANTAMPFGPFLAVSACAVLMLHGWLPAAFR